MTEIFLKLLNMSITASWLVLAVVVLRLLLKKAPKAIACALWGLVAIRLMFPISFESVLSLIPSAETVPQEIVYAKEPTIDSGVSIINQAVNPIITDTFAPPNELTSINPIQVFLAVAANLWILGIVGMLVYVLVSYLRLRRKVAEAVEIEQNVYLCDHVDTPFIFGIFRPRIYLPSAISETDMRYVLAHERAHLRRRDHLWKPLGFGLLTAYWFNPVLWVAYILLCRDIELACDERVIREMGTEEKKAYTSALLNCSVPRRMIAACPLAFGEVGVKQRIKSALHYKKPALWIIAVAVIASIVVAVCFLTDPKEEEELPEIYGHSYRVEEVTYGAPHLSYMMIAGENTPVYTITDDMYLLRKEAGADAQWEYEGELRDFILSSETFDQKFMEYLWSASPIVTELATLRENNASVWYLPYSDGLCYILQQKDGSIYLAYGHSQETFSWVFKLKEDETAGVEEHVDTPDLSHETTVAHAGYIRNEAIFTGALNRDKMMESSIQHLPIYKFESVAELEKFQLDFAEDIATRAHGEVPSFSAVAQQYDAEFFKEKTLLIVYVEAPSGSCRYDVGSVVWSEGSRSLVVHAELTRSPKTNDMEGWFLCVSMDKSFTQLCTTFDADLNAVSYADQLVGTWKTVASNMGGDYMPSATEASYYTFWADGTGTQIHGDKEIPFAYTTKGRLLMIRLSNNEIDPTKIFVYRISGNMLNFTGEYNSDLQATLQKTSVVTDTMLGDALFTAKLFPSGGAATVHVVDTGDQTVKLSVCKNGIETWSAELGTPHAGWSSFYLYRQGDQDYLLEYTPTMYQGAATYTYTLFYLLSSGSIVKRASSTLEFDLNDSASMDVDAIVSFVDEVNALLEQSDLIVSTLDGNKKIGSETTPVHLKETLSWLDDQGVPYSDGDTLREKLTKYIAEIGSFRVEIS